MLPVTWETIQKLMKLSQNWVTSSEPHVYINIVNIYIFIWFYKKIIILFYFIRDILVSNTFLDSFDFLRVFNTPQFEKDVE